LQHRLRARKGRVVERGTVDGTEDGLLFSVNAPAAPDRNVAAKSLMSARLSDLMTSPRRPALPSVMAQPVWLVLFSNSRSRAMALICISIPFCQISVQLLPLAMRSR
jgi:hypothetical protein